MQLDDDTADKIRGLAEGGSKTALYMYALHLQELGRHEEAGKYYLSAATKNYAPAQNNLGWMYRTGEGCPKNYPAAYAWFYLAAIQSNELAIHNLAEMFLTGDGVIKNFSMAEDLLIYGAAQEVVPPDQETQQGCNNAIIECRHELAWLHLSENYAGGATHSIAALWLSIAIMDLESFWPGDSDYRLETYPKIFSLAEKLWERLSERERIFVDYTLKNWDEESFNIRDRFGFPLTAYPICPEAWLTNDSASINLSLN